jgi:hypothetical protein
MPDAARDCPAGRSPRAVCVQIAVVELGVAVRRFRRRVDRERSRTCLRGGAEDPLLRREERDALAAVREPAIEAAPVGDVLTELRAQDVERGEAGCAEHLVGHREILRWR